MNAQEKEQYLAATLKLSQLWKELAGKGTYFEYRHQKNGWGRTAETPDVLSDFSRWRVANVARWIASQTNIN